MKKHFFLLFVSLTAAVFSQNSDRAALLIGNSAYASNALANSVNDATDMARALKVSGFEVTLTTDSDLQGMEEAVATFKTTLKGKKTALFYYAGHGVQIQGENYLIPVKEDIRSESQARSRGVAVSTVLEAIQSSGVGTALIFLDACRNNPFPGATRSGARGLSVIPAPKDVETLIAFAAEPGDTAQDGNGRNGVFTGAVLKNLAVPGISLSDLMTAVKADVKAATGGTQRPRVDDGLSKPFYFSDPVALALQTQAALEKNRMELDILDRKLTDLQAKIASSNDTKAKQSMENERQRQQALVSAKRLESDQLAQETERQKTASDSARMREADKLAAGQATQKQLDETAYQVSLRKQQVTEKIKDSATAEEQIGVIEGLETTLAEIGATYSDIWIKTSVEINKRYNQQSSNLATEQPEPTESDSEFRFRVRTERNNLEAQRTSDLNQGQKVNQGEQAKATSDIQKQLAEANQSLVATTWVLEGKDLTITPDDWDRNTKTWPFTVASTDPEVPVQWQVAIDWSRLPAPELKTNYTQLDVAVKAGALVGELSWKIKRDNQRFWYRSQAMFLLRDVVSGKELWRDTSSRPLGYLWVTVIITVPQAAIVSVNGAKIAGISPGQEYLWKARATDPLPLVAEYTQLGTHETLTIHPVPGVRATFTSPFSVGGRGPAGGIIFYDKGKISDGWRFLEAAPMDLEGNSFLGLNKGMRWKLFDDNTNISVPTDTDVGSGKKNTDTIILKQETRETDYAAIRCRRATIGGFVDWFLPSKDELQLMLIKLPDLNAHHYWSSSQIDAGRAWYLGGGTESYDGSDLAEKRFFWLVRPIRQF